MEEALGVEGPWKRKERSLKICVLIRDPALPLNQALLEK